MPTSIITHTVTFMVLVYVWATEFIVGWSIHYHNLAITTDLPRPTAILVTIDRSPAPLSAVCLLTILLIVMPLKWPRSVGFVQICSLGIASLYSLFCLWALTLLMVPLS